MALIFLDPKKKFKELSAEALKDINSPHWKALDPISEVKQNVMYYAYDVQKVLAQAKEGEAIPVFLEVEVEDAKVSTVLALKNIKTEKPQYYKYAALGWPPNYETVKSIYSPSNIIDFQNGIPTRMPKEKEDEIA